MLHNKKPVTAGILILPLPALHEEDPSQPALVKSTARELISLKVKKGSLINCPTPQIHVC